MIFFLVRLELILAHFKRVQRYIVVQKYVRCVPQQYTLKQQIWDDLSHFIFTEQWRLKKEISLKLHSKIHRNRSNIHVTPAVTWLKYCRYGVKRYPITQSLNQKIHVTHIAQSHVSGLPLKPSHHSVNRHCQVKSSSSLLQLMHVTRKIQKL